MATPPRPHRNLPPTPEGHGRCVLCGSLFVCKGRGRPRIYCSDPCKTLDWGLQRVEERIEELPPDAPKEGLADLRRRLWRAANLLNAMGKP